MRDETIAIHGGCQVDSARPVAVPLYQSVAYDFIDAEQSTSGHAAPLCASGPSLRSRS
jgi:O-acetylhomoserine/O-acetylserine sulfhydrylase-like pyridoxal-dependent enzyme